MLACASDHALTRGVASCTHEHHTAFVGVTGICLVGAYSAFCSLGLVAIACLLLLVVLLALLMLLGLTGCAWLAIVVLWGMRCT